METTPTKGTEMQVKVTTVGAAWTMKGEHVGPGPWLGLIHEVNRLHPKTFSEPLSMGTQEGRGYVEVYADADVVMVGNGAQDQLVTIESKTPLGADLIKRAAESMGLEIHED